VGPDDVIWEQSFGRQDAERSIATRVDTPFHLNGVTQVFTATLVLPYAPDDATASPARQSPGAAS